MHTRVKIFAGRNVKLVPDPRYLLKNFTFGAREIETYLSRERSHHDFSKICSCDTIIHHVRKDGGTASEGLDSFNHADAGHCAAHDASVRDAKNLTVSF